MKITVKAIMFKSNGNEIKTANVSLTKWIEGVYYTDPDPNDYNSINLYIEHNGVYAELDRCSQSSINESNKIKVENIIQDIEKWLLSLGWINLVHLEFAKQAGFNYDKLLKRRNEIKAERELKDKQKAEQREADNNVANERYANGMAEIKNKLISGAVLPMGKVIECYAFYKFKVHPRTLGTMYKVDGVISSSSATKAKGMSWNTHSSIIQTVKDFIAL